MKTYATERQVYWAARYLEWFSSSEAYQPYNYFGYDFDAERELINICISDGCLHTEDVIESNKNLHEI